MAYDDGTLVQTTGHPEVYVILGGQRHHIPDPQTFDLAGFKWDGIHQMTEQEAAGVLIGDDFPRFPFAVAPGAYVGSGGGHRTTAHVSLELATGNITGSVTTTNYVQLTGFHSGTLVVPRNEAGDPVTINLPGTFRFGVGARMFGDPATRTDLIGFSIGPEAAAKVHELDVIVSDNPDNLNQVLAKAGSIADAVKQWSWLIDSIKGFASATKGAGSQQQ